MTALRMDVKNWLRQFAGAVRDRNFAAGRDLFSEDTVSFGTICFRAEALNELEARQWKMVWPNTEGFDFEYESSLESAAGDQTVVLAGWTSRTCPRDGVASILRHGRATIVLRNTGAGWRAVHTHFSLEPSQHDPLLR